MDKVLESIIENLPFKMDVHVLVKPLKPVMVQKEFTEFVEKEDKSDGIDSNETRNEVKEVEATYQLGIVLDIPDSVKDTVTYKVGDVVAYKKAFALWFDLFKDSEMLRPYDIVGRATKPENWMETPTEEVSEILEALSTSEEEISETPN